MNNLSKTVIDLLGIVAEAIVLQFILLLVDTLLGVAGLVVQTIEGNDLGEPVGVTRINIIHKLQGREKADADLACLFVDVVHQGNSLANEAVLCRLKQSLGELVCPQHVVNQGLVYD